MPILFYSTAANDMFENMFDAMEAESRATHSRIDPTGAIIADIDRIRAEYNQELSMLRQRYRPLLKQKLVELSNQP